MLIRFEKNNLKSFKSFSDDCTNDRMAIGQWQPWPHLEVASCSTLKSQSNCKMAWTLGKTEKFNYPERVWVQTRPLRLTVVCLAKGDKSQSRRTKVEELKNHRSKTLTFALRSGKRLWHFSLNLMVYCKVCCRISLPKSFYSHKVCRYYRVSS